jgi:hypothetical protein
VALDGEDGDVEACRSQDSELVESLVSSGWAAPEARRLLEIIQLLLRLPDPVGAGGLFPEFRRLRDGLADALALGAAVTIEERCLELYAHLHMNDGAYSPEERQRLDTVGGYWNHAGGLSPILKARPWIQEATTSVDLGAGNGLQGLLLQALYPHTRTTQVEISTRMAEVGEMLREWLQVPRSRIEWIVRDVCDVPVSGYGFVYLYRPVRPDGPGRGFYARLAREVESAPRPPVIFSVADCLRDFLSSRFEVFYGDGHLTCYRATPSRPV